MKRSLLLLGIIAACCFLLNKPTTPVSAQRGAERASAARDDRELASTIKRLADQSMDGLTEQRHSDGSFSVDVGEKFQNVMLAKLDDDGDLAVGCVANLGEANAFFGRDLETGGKIHGAPRVPKYYEDEAARHGMTPREYQFYTDVIEKWRGRQESPQSATVTIVNVDGAGEGFNDASAAFSVGEGGNMGTTKGQQRQNLFQAAADVWDGFLDSAVPIPVGSAFNPMTPCGAGGAVLGSAGTTGYHGNHAAGVLPNTWYHRALANKQAGSDLSVGNNDMTAQFNLDIDSGCLPGVTRWYYGLDNATPANQINLFVVLLHEIGHGVGFSTRISSVDGSEAGGLDDIYATFAFDEDVSQYWNLMATNANRFTSIANADDVLWDGANVKIASGYLTAGRNPANGRVELYTPAAIAPGSSMSHFNTACTPSLLMEPFITSGLPLDLDLTKQQMRDIGWFRDETANGVADTITNITRSGTAVIGSNITIGWTNNGSFARNVTIELSTDGGLTFPTVVATNIANTGSYLWNVPNMPTSNARLRVREHNFVAPMGASALNFSILTTTAAAVTVWGRVTDTAGLGITKAMVSLTDSRGVTRTALTNSFGYFRFDDVASGATYVAAVRHKRYSFAAQPLTVLDEVTGLEFVASP